MKYITFLSMFLVSQLTYGNNQKQISIQSVLDHTQKIEHFVTANPKIKLSDHLKNKLEGHYRFLLSNQTTQSEVTSEKLKVTIHTLRALMAHDASQPLTIRSSFRQSEGSQTGVIIGQLIPTNGDNTRVNRANVRLYTSAGVYVKVDKTDEMGRFSFNSLSAGDYILVAEPGYSNNFISTLHNKIHCMGGLGQGCVPGQGEIIAVSDNEVQQLAFPVLSRSTLKGHLSSADGLNISYPKLAIYQNNDDTVYSMYVGNSGSFELAPHNLGDAYIKLSSSNHLSYVHPNIHCYEDCNPQSGTVVDLTSGGLVDLGSIELKAFSDMSGSVFDANTNTLITNQSYGNEIYAFNSDAELVATANQFSNGQWTINHLPDGVYHVAATVANYRTTFYPDSSCQVNSVVDCLNSGFQTVTHHHQQDTTGVDLYLEKSATISGTVRNYQSEISNGMEVRLYNMSGTVLRSTNTNNGFYEFSGLQAGHYRVMGYARSQYTFLGIPTMFGGQVCYDPLNYRFVCDSPNTGNTIALLNGQERNNVNITLKEGATISGTLRNEDGEQLSGSITAYYKNEYGTYSEVISTSASNGQFELKGLAGGNFKLKASSQNHISELYNNVQCMQNSCNYDSGHNIGLTNTSNIQRHFVLDDLETVTFNFNRPIANGRVKVYDAHTQQTVGSYYFGGSDSADIRLIPGSYKFKFSFSDGHFDKFYGGPNCYQDQDCAFAQGSTVTISRNQSRVLGINFDKMFLLNLTINRQVNAGHDWVFVEVFKNNNTVASYNFHSDVSETLEIPVQGYIKLTANIPGYQRQMYNGIVCTDECNLAQGHSINAQPNQSINITMNMDPKQKIRGRIFDHQDNPVSGNTVVLYSTRYNYLRSEGSTTTDQNGFYEFAGNLDETEGYVIKANGDDIQLDSYNDGVSCNGVCNMDDYLPFQITPNQTTLKHIKLKKKGVFNVSEVRFIGGGLVHDTEAIVIKDTDYSVRYDTDVVNGAISDWVLDVRKFKLAFKHNGHYTVFPNIDCGTTLDTACLDQGFIVTVPPFQNNTIPTANIHKSGVIKVTLKNMDDLPVSNQSVKLYSSSYSPVASRTTNHAGEVEFSGLANDQYIIFTSSNSDQRYVSSLYPDVPCPSGIGVGCVYADGELVSIGVNETKNLNMILPQNPSVNVLMKDAFTQEVLGDNNIRVFTENGTRIHVQYDPGIIYLTPGSYYFMVSENGYNTATWPNHICHGYDMDDCDNKELVTIQVNQNLDLTIESNISRGFYFQVMDGVNNAPINDAVIDSWIGTIIRNSVSTNTLGRAALINHDPNSSYHFSTDIGFGSNLFNEVHQNIQCPEGAAAYNLCDINQGMTVDPPQDGQYEVIEFILHPDPIFQNGFN